LKLSLKDPTLLRDACLVAGQWIAADSGGTIAVDNPSTGAVVGHVPNMGVAEARRAIEFATHLFRRGAPGPRKSVPSSCGAGSI